METKKEHIILEIKPEEKTEIILAAKKLSLGHSTFCRITSLKEARKILEQNKEQ